MEAGREKRNDDTCVIEPDDARNSFVRYRSYAYFRKTKIIAAAKVASDEDGHVPRGRMGESVVARMRAGIFRSPETSRNARNWCERFAPDLVPGTGEPAA